MNESPEVQPLIVVDGVGKRYDDAPAAIDDVSFTVARGEFRLLTGPTGAGKSTLLRLLAALESPSSGRIAVADADLSRLKPRARAALRRSLGIVPQELLLMPDRSALDNVMLPALVAGLPRRAAEQRARAALARVGVLAVDQFPQTLSGGAQQRIALARAIVNRPVAILADEPTAHLDDAAADGIVRLLDEFSSSGIAVVMASHGESVALPARTRVLRLANGRVAA